MLRDDEQLERAKPGATGLESYRRLIELQKQMIELSQHHARSRRECEALRTKVAREVADHARARTSLRLRWQHALIKLLKRWRPKPLVRANRFTRRIRPTPSASN